MVRTKVSPFNPFQKTVPVPRRDQSPARTEKLKERNWLIIVNAKDEHSSRQVRVREASIPDEIIKVVKKADMAIHIEEQLLRADDCTFEESDRLNLLGFLKAIGFKMNYPANCTTYPHLESLHSHTTGFVHAGALLKGKIHYRLNFTSDEHIPHYSMKEQSQFIEWLFDEDDDIYKVKPALLQLIRERVQE